MSELDKLRPLLERHGLRPDKSLGQHYLVSLKVIESIVRSVPEGMSVIEVGPGPGVLSQPLFERGNPMRAFEIDAISISVLRDRIPDLEVVHHDVLKADFESLVKEIPGEKWLVSNMPYNITGPLLTLFTKNRHLFAGQTLMMQKEVAQKILAKAGDRVMGSISIYLQSRFKIKHLLNAPPGAFYPPPRVDSEVLVLETDNQFLESSEEVWFEKFVRSGFIQPRKTLANNLGTLLAKSEAIELIAGAGLAANIRPHQVELEQWLQLSRNCSRS